MDFTNINDPAGIKALLEQLRTSQAWRETDVDVTPARENSSALDRDSLHGPPIRVPASSDDIEVSSSTVSSHISALLSQLQPGSSAPSSPLSDNPSNILSHCGPHQESALPSLPLKIHDSRNNPGADPSTRHTPAPTKSLRTLPFIQALPIVAELAGDPTFIEKIEKMRKDQELLEERLWKDRMHILKNQEEKVKVARAKAEMVGNGLDRREANALESSFSKELKAFDADQALPAWDALVAKQQSILEALRVPGMFVTALKTDREKQTRIIQVLDGLSGPEDEDVSVRP